jgi:hypothetical protein
MRTISKDELTKILADHKEWRRSDGALGSRAYLGGADLGDADLGGADHVPAIPQTSDAPAPAPQTYEEWLAKRPKNDVERAKRYRERHPEVPVVELLDAKILAAIESGKGRLEMSGWHGDNPRNADGEACGTTHCRAGWAIHLAGRAGYALEDRFDSAIAGRMIYLASTGRAPNFYERSNEIALADIKQCAAEQTASPETT